jgi:predicted RNase H-like HicB family nuclease
MSQGKTIEAALRNVRHAIRIYLKAPKAIPCRSA